MTHDISPKLSPRMKPKLSDPRKDIINILNNMHPAEAIKLIESIGKERRKTHSIKVNADVITTKNKYPKK